MLDRKRKSKPFGMEIRTGEVGGILSKLYRQILHDLGITPDRYEALMQRYIKRAHLGPNRNEKAAARAGLSKELLKASMTFKTWIKGIVFLAISKIKITVTLYHENGKVTDHSVTVVLDELTNVEGGDSTDEKE